MAAAEACDKRCQLGFAVLAALSCLTAWLLLLLRISASSSLRLPRRFHLHDLRRLSAAAASISLAHGSAFPASLPNGSLVTVHRLRRLRRPQQPAFLADLASICRLRHRGLASLHGWCLERRQATLVYASLPARLDVLLFGAAAPLDGDSRMNILRKVGEAVAYMHENGVLHAAMGLENIVVGDDDEAVQIEGAGIACRIVANDVSAEWLTKPHVAPEIRYTGKATAMADVYSFGVLALQLACGRRAVHGDFHLLPWLYLLHSNGLQLADAIDPSLLKCTPPPPPPPSSSSSPPVVSSAIAPQSTLPRLEVPLSPFPSSSLSSSSSSSIHTPPTSSSLPIQHPAPPSNSLPSPTQHPSNNTDPMHHSPQLLRRWLCVLHLALLCCHPLIEARPTMRQALMVLDELRILPLPASLHSITCWGANSTAEESSVSVELT